MKSDDIFCKIVAGEIPSYKVYENEDFFAFLDINPVNPGHTLLIPKEHYEYLFDMPEKAYTDLWLKAKELAPIIQKVTGAKRIGIVVEGFAVPHVHIHLAPINGPGELDSTNQRPANPEDLVEMAERIKTALSF